MLKTQIVKELAFNGEIDKGSFGNHVKVLQEWLKIHHLQNPHMFLDLNIDKDFGDHTALVLENYQLQSNCIATGKLDKQTWTSLTKDLHDILNLKGVMISEMARLSIIDIASLHLRKHVVEISPNNGPFVRWFMDGWTGKRAPWCVGWVLTVLDQYYSAFDRKFTEIIPNTYHTDPIGKNAIKNGTLMPYANYNPNEVQPGDIFLINKVPGKNWLHIGFVSRVIGSEIITIEGNTNSKGGFDGWEVCLRIRDVKKERVDIVKMKY